MRPLPAAHLPAAAAPRLIKNLVMVQFPLMYKCWGFEIKRQINRTTATPHQMEVGAEIVDNFVTIMFILFMAYKN